MFINIASGVSLLLRLYHAWFPFENFYLEIIVGSHAVSGDNAGSHHFLLKVTSWVTRLQRHTTPLTRHPVMQTHQLFAPTSPVSVFRLMNVITRVSS